MRKDDAEISDWDVADYLKTEIEVRYFLEEILNANDPKLLQMALGDVARSAGMAKIAKKAGLNRESLYKALKEEAHPRFETVMRVFNAMGMKLSLTPYVAEKPAKYSTKKEPKTKKGGRRCGCGDALRPGYRGCFARKRDSGNRSAGSARDGGPLRRFG